MLTTWKKHLLRKKKHSTISSVWLSMEQSPTVLYLRTGPVLSEAIRSLHSKSLLSVSQRFLLLALRYPKMLPAFLNRKVTWSTIATHSVRLWNCINSTPQPNWSLLFWGLFFVLYNILIINSVTISIVSIYNNKIKTTNSNN